MKSILPVIAILLISYVFSAPKPAISSAFFKQLLSGRRSRSRNVGVYLALFGSVAALLAWFEVFQVPLLFHVGFLASGIGAGLATNPFAIQEEINGRAARPAE